MAYDDTKWGGFAKIIVDTSTMTVGDTVRVKSITTGTNYDKQVVTVGTPLIWETDIYKDYVKICMVQTINDTPTEIGGVYKTVDYGQTLYINVLDKTTLGGIQGILNAHQETSLLNIGDEVNVLISGVEEKYVICGLNLYDSHEALFISKYLSDTDANLAPANYSARTSALSFLNSLYSNIDERDRQYIKDKVVKYYNWGAIGTVTQKVWIPSTGEVTGYANEINNGVKQFPMFATQSSRIKYSKDGIARLWQTASCTQASGSTDYLNTSGAMTYAPSGNTRILSGFRLVADS